MECETLVNFRACCVVFPAKRSLSPLTKLLLLNPGILPRTLPPADLPTVDFIKIIPFFMLIGERL